MISFAVDISILYANHFAKAIVNTNVLNAHRRARAHALTHTRAVARHVFHVTLLFSVAHPESACGTERSFARK